MKPDEKKKLLDQLDALKIFPNNKLVKELRKQVLAKLEKSEPKIPFVQLEKDVNLTRSTKLKKYHKYLRLIRDNFPNHSYGKIRKEFSKRKRGFEGEIPDAVWQNPSP